MLSRKVEIVGKTWLEGGRGRSENRVPCPRFLASQTLAVTPGASGSLGYQDGHQGQHQVKTPVHLWDIRRATCV